MRANLVKFTLFIRIICRFCLQWPYTVVEWSQISYLGGLSMTDIKQLLISLGISRTYAGFHQLAYAVDVATQNEDALLRVTKDLYPVVAKHFNTSPDCIERNIRTVIHSFWKRGNRALFNEIAKYELENKPQPGYFISILAAYCGRHSPGCYPDADILKKHI